MDEGLRDIPISDVTVTFDIRTVDGRRGISSGITYSEPLPLALYGIWALRQGIPVGVVSLAGEQSPPPYDDCIQILIATDQTSMWGRKCQHCKRYWRTGTPGLASTTVCCYCGRHSKAFECLSDAQQAYVEACCILYSQLLDLGKDGHYSVRTRELLAQAMAPEDGEEPAPPEFFVESQNQTRFTCEACGNLNDVLGRFAYCSGCGTRNDAGLLRKDMAELQAILQPGGNATIVLKEAVDKFDAVGRNVARQLVAHVPMTKSRRERWEKANFQQIGLIARNLQADFDIDMLGKISPADQKEVELRFHRRHLHAHLGSIVDQKYIDDSGDTTVQVGLMVQERRESVLPFIHRLISFADNLIRGFHSIIPVQDGPIRFHQERQARIKRPGRNDPPPPFAPTNAGNPKT